MCELWTSEGGGDGAVVMAKFEMCYGNDGVIWETRGLIGSGPSIKWHST